MNDNLARQFAQKKYAVVRACVTEPWPIMIECSHGTVAVELAPGDAVLYRGIECAHWRDAFEGNHIARVILNHVDQNGPCAEWKFDKRPASMFKRPSTETTANSKTN
jgi:hypothetical protein